MSGKLRNVPKFLLPRALVVDHCGEAVGAACEAVLDAAPEHVSSARSSNAGKLIREIFNLTIAVRRPGLRIVEDIDRANAFSPALSAARFLYMLSGSDQLAPIRFYTKSITRHTDDGLRVPGSSYGARIFRATDDGVTAFEQIARVIERRPATKRAFLPIFAPHDVERAIDTNDLPCASSLHFAFANGTLNSTAFMRANDAAKLLAYNLFEFSLLAECLAARLNVSYGVHVHTAASMHLRDRGILSAQSLAGAALGAVGTTRIDRFDEELRQGVIELEAELRAQAGQPSIRPLLARILAGKREMLWNDLLLAALLAGRATSHAAFAQRDDDEIEKYLGHVRRDMPITFAELRLRRLTHAHDLSRVAN